MRSSNLNFQPVLIHPAIESVSGDLSDLLTRLDFYGGAYKKSGGEHPLRIYCAIPTAKFLGLDLAQFKNLELIRVCNSSRRTFYFIFRVYISILRRKLKPSIFIAGDLKLGLCASLILKLLLFGKFDIQVSLHGNPFVGKFLDSKWLSGLYRKCLRLSFRVVSSVRVVSKPIAELAQTEFGVNPEKIFICQVPITFQPDFLDKRMQCPVIGVVGRLHPERGIESVIQILTPLLSSNSKIRAIIVGKGELFSLVNAWRASSSFHEQVEIIGEVPQRNLQVVWDKINILLSAAPSEGYGLALREALISGAIVVAKQSDGTIALTEELESGIKLFKTNEQALEILQNLVNNLQTQQLNPNVGALQSETDRIALERLAITWHKSS